jgi:integrase
VLRPVSGNPIDRRDAYRMVARIATVAGIPRHISPHSLRHSAITNARVLVVIAYRDLDDDLHGINAWPATGADPKLYQQGDDDGQDD